MLDVVREQEEPVSLLDLGCGLAHLLDHLECRPERRNVDYLRVGHLERVPGRREGAASRSRLVPTDILESDADLPEYDYVVLNGVFNLPWRARDEESMLRYWQQLTSVAYRHCRRGIAFNVMSKIVDWERDDLFHLPFDSMARFVADEP